jgi:hypothetical protein
MILIIVILWILVALWSVDFSAEKLFGKVIMSSTRRVVKGRGSRKRRK